MESKFNGEIEFEPNDRNLNVKGYRFLDISLERNIMITIDIIEDRYHLFFEEDNDSLNIVSERANEIIKLSKHVV
jgi:hypothetical protein